MHISFFSSESGFNSTVGYGQAGMGIVTSLQKLGHLVTLNNEDADIQLNFVQPTYYKFNRPTQYTIGYTPWESTVLPMYWLENMNKCDEVWATSAMTAKFYKDAGVEKPIKVYHHGLHDVWKKPKIRRPGSKFRFLHIGEPAPRKGGELVIQAFIELFGNDPQYELTLKCHNANTIRYKDMFGNHVDIKSQYPNIKFVVNELTDEGLVNLMHQNDCLVYPSYGEGFGFIPLQAMATAMPTICTTAWAPYADLITLKLDSILGDSPWPLMHPGKVFFPSKDHLKKLMLDVVSDFEKYSAVALRNTTKIYEQFDWVKLTEKAFKDLPSL